MTGALQDVADGVVTDLNAGSWSQSFTAARVALPEFTVPDLATLQVPVAIRSTSQERLTRTRVIDVVEIDIGVMKKIDVTGSIGKADVDPFVTLVDEIAEYFFTTRLSGFPTALPTVSTPDPVYDQEYLEKKRAFFAIVRLEFRVFN